MMEALGNRDLETHAEAVLAAGNWSLEAAGDHVEALVEDARTPKPLRLAAIEALGSIRPREAMEVYSIWRIPTVRKLRKQLKRLC
jgi:hypothetical protein